MHARASLGRTHFLLEMLAQGSMGKLAPETVAAMPSKVIHLDMSVIEEYYSNFRMSNQYIT